MFGSETFLKTLAKDFSINGFYCGGGGGDGGHYGFPSLLKFS